MDNELFELCKEVYKKTVWDDESLRHKLGGEIYDRRLFQSDTDEEHPEESYHPMYTSDYLLEKLPSGARIQKDSAMMGEAQFYVASMVYYKGTPKEYMLNCGDKTSPLKALLKLTLALHGAGELK